MTDITRPISIEQLEEWGLPDHRDVTVSMETEDVGRRWMDVCTVVFKAPDDGLHYSFCFDVGKTENQQEHWTYELDNPVTCTRVELVRVTVEKWLPVAAEVAQ